MRSALAFTLTILALAAPASAQDRTPTGAPRGTTPTTAPAGSPVTPPPDGQETLVRAYQREYSFLATEEAALRSRLAELQEERGARATAAARALADLEERLRALRLEVEAERASVAKLDEERGHIDDGNDSIGAVLAQADALLPPRAGATPVADTAASRAAGVERALDGAIGLLRARATIRREAGRFFDATGAEARGELVWIGAVAVLGASPAHAGALAPAGSGALQLWPAPTATAPARAAAGGALPDVLPLFLFESLDKSVAQPKDEGVAEVIDRGGDVAWVLVGLGAVASVLVLLRVVILSRASGSPDPILAAISPLLADGRASEAQAHVGRQRGAAARVIESMLPALGQGAERVEGAGNERLLKELLRIERFETAILVTASVAPLLGLLGTVTGMIATFDVITKFGSGDPRLLAGGISEALVATALGLLVAIPALVLGNILSSWTESLRVGMERAALRVLLIETERPQVAAAEVEPEAEVEVEAGAAVEPEPAGAVSP